MVVVGGVWFFGSPKKIGCNYDGVWLLLSDGGGCGMIFWSSREEVKLNCGGAQMSLFFFFFF